MYHGKERGGPEKCIITQHALKVVWIIIVIQRSWIYFQNEDTCRPLICTLPLPVILEISSVSQAQEARSAKECLPLDGPKLDTGQSDKAGKEH